MPLKLNPKRRKKLREREDENNSEMSDSDIDLNDSDFIDLLPIPETSKPNDSENLSDISSTSVTRYDLAKHLLQVCKKPFARNNDLDSMPKSCEFLAKKLNTQPDNENLIGLVKAFFSKVKYFWSNNSRHFDTVYRAHKVYFDSKFVLKRQRKTSETPRAKKQCLDGKFYDRIL